MFKEREALGNEAPLLETFCFKYDIATGVAVIAIFDFVFGLIWFALIFFKLKDGLWPFYLLYLSFSLVRLYYFYKCNEEDGEKTRYSMFKSNSLTSMGYITLFFIHFIVAWAQQSKFPLGLFFFILVFSCAMMYFQLVMRQYFLNYLTEIKEMENFEYGHILHSDLSE